MTSPVETSLDGRVFRIALNRPEKKNALSFELCHRLADEVERAGDDPKIGCILVEARGDVFCAGMDLSETLQFGHDGGDSRDLAGVHERLFTLGMRISKPIVAAVTGPALGGGVGLIANAHVVVSAHGCTFGLTEIRVGMWPYFIWRSVVNAIGERRTLALALTGRIFSANEALQWGLVHEVAPAFEVDDRATATAEHLASSAADAMRLGLTFAREIRHAASDEAAELTSSFREEAMASDDFREGVAAFREKRKPSWHRREPS